VHGRGDDVTECREEVASLSAGSVGRESVSLSAWSAGSTSLGAG